MVHVVPLCDMVEHEVAGALLGDVPGLAGKWAVLTLHPAAPESECPCGPTAQMVKTVDGGDGWIMVHNSLDGRERFELDREDVT